MNTLFKKSYSVTRTRAFCSQKYSLNHEKIEKIKKGWNCYAQTYSQKLENHNLTFGMSLFSMLKINVNSISRIIDAGCGTGDLTFYMMRRLQEEYLRLKSYELSQEKKMKIQSIDIAEEMLQIANSKKEIYSQMNPHIFNFIDQEFIVGNLEELSTIESNSIDVYISNLCLHLVPNVSIVLQEARRILKPTGKIAFSVFGRREKSQIFSLLDDTIEQLRFPNPHSYIKTQFHLSDRKKLIEIVENNGYDVEFSWYQSIPFNWTEEKEYDELVYAPANRKLIRSFSNEEWAKILLAYRQKIKESLEAKIPLGEEALLVVARKKQFFCSDYNSIIHDKDFESVVKGKLQIVTIFFEISLNIIYRLICSCL